MHCVLSRVLVLTLHAYMTTVFLGFLGLLHMDVFRQRLEQEHNVEVIVTSPSVGYKVLEMGLHSDKFDVVNGFVTVVRCFQVRVPTLVFEWNLYFALIWEIFFKIFYIFCFIP